MVFFNFNYCSSQVEVRSEAIDKTFDRLELLGVNADQSILLYSYFFSTHNTYALNQFKDSLLLEPHYEITINLGDYDRGFEIKLEEKRVHSRQSLLATLDQLDQLAVNCGAQLYFESIEWSVNQIDSKSILPDLSDFEYGLTQDGDSTIYQKAIRLMHFGYFDYAILSFELCINNSYSIDSCLYKIAQCYWSMQKTELSYKAYKKLYILNPDSPEMLSSIAWSFNSNKDYQDAIECYERVIELDSLNINSMNSIGLIYFNSEDFRSAQSYFNRTLEIDASNQLAKNYIARIKKKGL